MVYCSILKLINVKKVTNITNLLHKIDIDKRYNKFNLKEEGVVPIRN